ncbi:HAD hydrolase-like protein [Sinomonas sp. JGH33]|uniref:HAD hydrolase-like protein n=1 Tax=Sinomonas terricola TaxID=3110330 RepID=A0ABU5T3X3_9MICC|nr:HAD hydrolase-like protein [Sinomonas sp. JGH33]MEA5454359.1 HAD hydrolase-like protein [Sinomonas sp. JGH33]
MTDSPALVIFDLDGTLVDPAGSITGGIAFALEAHGLPVPDAATLDSMVGPPLVESLARLADVPAEVVPAVVHAYRRRYISAGMAQSRPYPGIRELLDRLREAGYHLAVATQKPESLAKKLLTIQGLDSRFHSIHGAPDDETLPPLADGKASIVAAALSVNHAAPERSVMIGDRRHDAAGAAANGLPCIAVTWGFAEPGELEALDLAARVADAREAGDAVERLLPLDGRAVAAVAAPVLSGSADPEPVEADSCR